MKQYSKVLTIAGSDSGGGAGIQADIKTISALGCYAASAITAITVQNTQGVTGVHPVPVSYVRGQIKAVLEDIGADSVKIGMLQSGSIVDCVAQVLARYHITDIVLDPVMVSTSGHRLIEESAVEALKQRLIPMSRVITPNIPEAEILLGGFALNSLESLSTGVRKLADMFGVSVLLKAGHLEGERLVDYFYNIEDDELVELPSRRIETVNTHGTGCTMSSAFAANLAKGMSLTQAAVGAKEYINNAIISGSEYEIGHGHGPVNHFFILS